MPGFGLTIAVALSKSPTPCSGWCGTCERLQERRTWMEAFLVVAQTGQASAAASQAPHRHRRRHGSSGTDASVTRQALHDVAPDTASAAVAAATPPGVSKQHDCASSTSPSPAAAATAQGDWRS
ncbi:hypothetical protein OsI_34394 [Oryza sativa Indica Group]|uniref:Uncharacterized protein n=1 Tax=Oryza sativa subsp. indica TaxID=39946 RepID=B8BHY7_ORYSI|nr:hypothetical protein OsI_34394 [Oryza sativa Indica Group]